jgi:hypothetical protein
MCRKPVSGKALRLMPPTGIEPVHAVWEVARPRRLLYRYVRCVGSVRVRGCIEDA